MNELALFAGAGCGILGGKILGWRTICAVEINAFCARRLMQRQNEGYLPPFPIWDDVCSFNGRPWKGIVDVVSGGFPCQDISCAGTGKGLDGERSGLWREQARIICDVEPIHALVENSAVLTSRGLGIVLGDLASMGFNAEWGVFTAADAMWSAGNPAFDQLRERIFIKATHPDRVWRLQQERGIQNERKRSCNGDKASTYSGGIATEQQVIQAHTLANGRKARIKSFGGNWWASEPELERMVHGTPYRVDRDRAIGNGQIPAVVELAWETLK